MVLSLKWYPMITRKVYFLFVRVIPIPYPVVMLETSISQPSITSLLNCFPGIIYSGGATYLASETYTTKVMWKFASAQFEHTLIDTFNTTTLQ